MIPSGFSTQRCWKVEPSRMGDLSQPCQARIWAPVQTRTTHTHRERESKIYSYILLCMFAHTFLIYSVQFQPHIQNLGKLINKIITKEHTSKLPREDTTKDTKI